MWSDINIFDGKSKIIRNFGIFFLTLFMFILTPILVYFIVVLLLSCYKSLIGIPIFVFLFLQIDHGRSNRGLHCKGATNSDTVFVVRRCITSRNPLKTYGTIREQCLWGVKGVSTNGLKYSKNGRTSVTHEKEAGRRDGMCPQMMIILNVHVTWFCIMVYEMAYRLQISQSWFCL